MMRTKALLVALIIAVACGAKTIKTVVLTTTPQMHCSNCEQEIKKNLRFERGIKAIRTDLSDKTVTVEYDADKTNVENIIKGFKKIKYEASEVKPASTKVTDKQK